MWLETLEVAWDESRLADAELRAQLMRLGDIPEIHALRSERSLASFWQSADELFEDLRLQSAP